jgi:hypothetical protein
MVQVVLITHCGIIVMIGSQLDERFIRDGTAPVEEKRVAVEDEDQVTPSVGRYSDFRRRSGQLDRAFIVEGAVLSHAMDVNGRADA